MKRLANKVKKVRDEKALYVKLHKRHHGSCYKLDCPGSDDESSENDGSFAMEQVCVW